MRIFRFPRRKTWAVFAALVALIIIASLQCRRNERSPIQEEPETQSTSLTSGHPFYDYEAFFELDEPRQPREMVEPNLEFLNCSEPAPYGEKLSLGLLVLPDLIMEETVDIFPEISPGGNWKPVNCSARQKVAIIIPYRDRSEHLVLILTYLIPLLKHQQLDFRFIVSEQIGDDLFNKGRIMNAGFTFAEKFGVDCVIFHDVDMIPENLDIPYRCPQRGFAGHLGAYVNKFGYNLLYDGLVGGVLAFNVADFVHVNGYSSEYWTWGGEDDDMAIRIIIQRMDILRPRKEDRYTMIKHLSRYSSSKGNRKLIRKLLNNTVTNMVEDGLNNPKWKIKKVELKPLFYHLFVDVGDPPTQWKAKPKNNTDPQISSTTSTTLKSS